VDSLMAAAGSPSRRSAFTDSCTLSPSRAPCSWMDLICLCGFAD
jgi:hypothetical protein